MDYDLVYADGVQLNLTMKDIRVVLRSEASKPYDGENHGIWWFKTLGVIAHENVEEMIRPNLSNEREILPE